MCVYVGEGVCVCVCACIQVCMCVYVLTLDCEVVQSCPFRVMDLGCLNPQGRLLSESECMCQLAFI